MQQYIVVGQLLAQTFEQTHLGLYIKPLGHRIGDAPSHAKYLAEPTGLTRICAKFEDYSIIPTPTAIKGP